MAQFYTLDEAAEKLGLAPAELKKRLKTDPEFKKLSQIPGGDTLRLRQNEVNELVRVLGGDSEPELRLPPLAAPPDRGSDEFKVPTDKGRPKPADEPLLFADDDSDDVFSLSANEPTPVQTQKPKKDGDSDVRLDAGKPRPKPAHPSAGVPTEEIAIDFAGPGSAVIKGGSSAKLTAPSSAGKLTSDSGKNLANQGLGDSSEFELSLDADSDDFELKLNADPSDEIALGDAPAGRQAGASGINLGKPADSGISLEKKGKGKKPAPPTDDSDDFDLSLDPPAGGVSGAKLGGPRSAKFPVTSASDSEFELTLDGSSEHSLENAVLSDVDGGKNDIFETDFEIPLPDDSGSESRVARLGLDIPGSRENRAVHHRSRGRWSGALSV